MHNRLEKILLLTLLLVLPLQSFAAALMPLTCHRTSDDQQQAAVSVHAHGTDASSGHSTGSHDDQQSEADYSGHLCCHHPAGVIFSPLITTADTGPSNYFPQALVWPPLFSPEQQLRPPRG